MKTGLGLVQTPKIRLLSEPNLVKNTIGLELKIPIKGSLLFMWRVSSIFCA